MNQHNLLSNLPINVVALVLLVLTASGQIFLPLSSARPENTDVAKDWKDNSFTEIRLWQDPLDKFKFGERNSDTSFLLADNLLNELDARKKVIVAAISIPGSSYSEMAEMRRRARFAVVSALDTEQYYPEQSNHIKLFRYKPEILKDWCSLENPVEIPYEWFSTADLASNVLILWLNEHMIKLTELEYATFVQCLAKQLDHTWKSAENINRAPFSFKLIGPSNTDLLMELLRVPDIQESQQSTTVSTNLFSGGSFFETYIYNATVPDASIVDRLRYQECQDGSTPENGGRKYWYCNRYDKEEALKEALAVRKIYRFIGTDDKLATAIFWELYQRGVNKTTTITDFVTNSSKPDCNDGIVLIAELDTFYSRTLVNQMRNNDFWKHCGNKRGKNIDKDKDATVKNDNLITSFSYLRGIDGKLSSDSYQIKKNTDVNFNNNPVTQWDDAPPEHAEGRNQYDYLRRLTESIAALDDDPNFAKNGVKAIGVIGSDVYDKLIVLQALREKFTNKILFTTDLDARYLHKDQQKWTRNLVVASNFDFKLDHELQGNSMPFRDSFQTALYYATWSAVCKEVEECKKPAIKKEFLDRSGRPIVSNPQVFEIGKTRAIHLDSLSVNYLKDWVECINLDTRRAEQQSEKRKCVVELLDQYDDRENNLIDSDRIWRNYKHSSIESKHSWERERTTIIADKILQLIVTAIVIVFLYHFLLLKWVGLSPVRSFNNGMLVISITTVLVLGFILLPFTIIEAYQDADISEPVYWLEGVSVWPNLFIRYFGLITIILLFITFFNWLRECNKQNSKNLASVVRVEFWVSYFSDTYQKKMWRGIGIVSLCFTILSYFVLAGKTDMFEEALNFPYRGAIVNSVHTWLFVIQMFCLFVLVFWTAFETISCKKMIEEMRTEKQDDSRDQLWSNEAMQLAEVRTGVPHHLLHRYLQFQLIVDHAKCISRLIYLPLGMIFFILIGRSKIFDQFGMPWSLIIILIVSIVYVIIVTYHLRVAAEKFRMDLMDQYEAKKIQSNNNTIQIDRLVSLIRQENQGVYASLGHQAALTALLIPFGGMSGVQILEYLFNI
ncbi:hypothetical protein [Nitrosomonas sp. sh817]|uniref:hypothetical protein n=1 Tax=Nitrosomonas sp. sh817 TaxID=3070658 RepID=UPI0027DB9A49|nr:hypothetical protein [Nitrosomonas sp. sh817]WMJ07568.1 hypothetical protein RBH92_08980 [Nitrosomonas sp. sh817]